MHLQEDMLKKENKYFWFGLVYSCQLNKTSDIQKQVAELHTTAIKNIGKTQYKSILKQANDSIIEWSKQSLNLYSFKKKQAECILDSILCFNKKQDEMISCILVKEFFKESVMDDILFFYGVKIHEKWFFFRGPSIVIPRSMYKQPTNKPLSFEKLHEIAMKEVYRGYLLPNGEINDAFFSDLTSGAWCSKCTTQEEWNNAYLKQVRNNWADRDTSMQLP